MQDFEGQQPKVFRQRLTVLGWLGVACALGGPIALGFALSDYVDVLGNRYGAAGLPAVEALVLSLLSVSGWIMILVGREYYAFYPLVTASHNEPDERDILDRDHFKSG